MWSQRFFGTLASPLIALSTALVGCNQIGGEIDDYGETGGENCSDGDSSALSLAAEPFGEGVPVQTLLNELAGAHVSELDWALLGGGVTVSPEDGDYELTIQVEPDESTARLVSRHENSGRRGEIDTGPCGPQFRVDATVDVSGGPFDFSVPATFSADSSWLLSARIDLDEIVATEGNFSVVPESEEEEVTQLTFVLNSARGFVSGEITGLLQGSNSEVAWGSGLELGRFPASSECEYGAPLGDDSAVGADLDSWLAALPLLQADFASGPAVQSSATWSRGPLCLSEQYEPSQTGELRFPVHAQWESEDSRLAGSMGMIAVLEMEQGSITAVSYRREWHESDSPEDFTGLYPMESGDFGRGVELRQASKTEVSGTVEMTVFTTTDCPEPQTDKEFEQFENGEWACEGHELRTLEEVELSALQAD